MANENTLFVVGDREYTAEDAQKKIENADEHISKIEAENADLRSKIDEYMEALAKTAIPRQEQQSNGDKGDKDTKQVIDAEEIAKLVKAELEKTRTVDTQTSNLGKVRDALKGRFGSERAANEEFEKVAAKNGISVDRALELAKEYPQLVLNWFGETNTPPRSGPTPTGHNTQAIANSGTGPKEGTWAWWQEMRRNDPKAYNSPSMARRRMQDAERLGREGFFGTN